MRRIAKKENAAAVRRIHRTAAAFRNGLSAIAVGDYMIPAIAGPNPALAVAPTIGVTPGSFIPDDRTRSAADDGADASATASSGHTADNRTGCAADHRATSGAALCERFSADRRRHDCKHGQCEQKSVHLKISQTNPPKDSYSTSRPMIAYPAAPVF
jgi:hypothetical protein